MKTFVEVSGRVDENFKSIADTVAKQTIKFLKQPDCFELSIKFVSENEIKRLNAEFRNIDRVTDVLSFPSTNIKAGETFSKQIVENFFSNEDELFYLGDMAICLKQLKRQAKEFETSDFMELKKLVIHSMLHLFGYDHIRDSDYLVMKEKEDFLDKKIKI